MYLPRDFNEVREIISQSMQAHIEVQSYNSLSGILLSAYGARSARISTLELSA
jgi:hypothetical protein